MKWQLEVRVVIRQVTDERRYTGQQLDVSEQFEVPATSFMEVAGILGKFHDLAEVIKHANAEEC